MSAQPHFAVIDLGSNSFRLEIGTLEAGHLRRVAYIKETVRQGNGLDDQGHLTRQAMQRGWDCLARFAERIAGYPIQQVRAVATQTLREARNREVFLSHAQTLLGYPIEVITGQEEARLIYLGVSHLLPPCDERRLVIDIGGRSTELILGQHEKAHTLASYHVGSVAWSMAYFPEGLWTASAFRSAEIAAQAVLDEAITLYPRDQWDACYGASGTVGAIADVLGQAGWPSGLISREGLRWLKAKLLKARTLDALKLDGLKEDRRTVIGGGLSVLQAIFDLLEIDTMQAAQGALRHGAVLDLLDRRSPQGDIRSSKVSGLMLRLGIDSAQANRVSRTAQSLLQLMLIAAPKDDMARCLRQLGWAAQLHEVGMCIAHDSYHKHGAYILDNSDLSGFTIAELHHLSQLVLGHCGKLRKVQLALEDPWFAQQLMAIRLSVLLCHARKEPDIAQFHIQSDAQSRVVRLSTTPTWCKAWPRSAHLLHEEATAWQKVGWTLKLNMG